MMGNSRGQLIDAARVAAFLTLILFVCITGLRVLAWLIGSGCHV